MEAPRTSWLPRETVVRWLVVISVAEDTFEVGAGCERCAYILSVAVAFHFAVANFLLAAIVR